MLPIKNRKDPKLSPVQFQLQQFYIIVKGKNIYLKKKKTSKIKYRT